MHFMRKVLATYDEFMIADLEIVSVYTKCQLIQFDKLWVVISVPGSKVEDTSKDIHDFTFNQPPG